MKRKDLIHALGRILNFSPIFIEKEVITGRYAHKETYFKAYERNSLFQDWFIEKPVIEFMQRFPHANHKIFIFITRSRIDYIVLDLTKFLNGNWNYEKSRMPATTRFRNNSTVDKLGIYIPMEYCEVRGFFDLTPMNNIQIDTSIAKNLEDLKPKPKKLF